MIPLEDIEMKMRRVHFFNTHLSYGNQEPARIEQVKVLKPFIAEKSRTGMGMANILISELSKSL
jgi:hypothetical protein